MTRLGIATATGAFAVIALTCATPAVAQEAHARGTDPLGPLVAEALLNNASLAAERAAEVGAAARVREARALYLPSLTLDARYSEQNGTVNLGDFVNPAYTALNELTGTQRFPTDLDLTLPLRHESRLRLAQPVFNEAIRGNHAAARHLHEAQRQQRRAASRRLAAEVQVAYLNVAAARSAVAIYESTLCLVTENERVAQRLVDAGQATPEVLFRARAERSDVEQQLAESTERVGAAARVLNQLVGRPLDAPLDSVPESSLVRALPIDEAAALAHALEHREELEQLDAGARAADAGVRVATAAFLPSVSVALDYGYQGREVSFSGDQDFVVASLVVSWNLFNGGGDGARRQIARAEADRLRAQRRDAEERVRLDVRQSYEAAAVAHSAIETASDRLAAARRTFELVQRRYDEAVATHIEFVDARTALTNAELNHSLTKYRYAMRIVDLERAAALRVID
jgi:outer membrane protein TolC